jgi:hypothetical protein
VTSYFHEDQHFRGSWLWVVIALPIGGVLVASILGGSRGDLLAVLIPLAAVALIAAILALARLETTVDDRQLVIAFHGMWPTRQIPLDRIASYTERTYGIFDSGGWGVHLGLAGMTYNVSGNKGVQLVLRDGGRVLLGTQRPDELVAGLDRAMATRRGGEERQRG